MVPPSDHPLVESLEALHLALADVFGNILYLEFVNCLHIFKEKLMEVTQTHYLKMTPKVHAHVQYVLNYRCHTGDPLEPPSSPSFEIM